MYFIWCLLVVAQSISWVPDTGIYIHRKKKITKLQFISLILWEKPGLMQKQNVFFHRKEIWNSLWPVETLQENTRWTVVPFFELMIQSSFCFSPKTHLKMKSQWLSKTLLYSKNRLKNLSVHKYLLLPFILNSYLKNPPNLLINHHLIESFNKFRVLQNFHY